MSVVKWIHFSDLHFNKTNINTRLLRDSIKSFLKEKNIKCDYAFFSGDLRNAPDKCFQKDSVKYLKELCEAVEVSTDRFFMVPGNHDIDRDIEKRDRAVKRILNNYGKEKGYYDPEEGKIREEDLFDIKIGQAEYLKIIEEFYQEYPERIEKYKEIGHFLIETEDFNIIHLDSTITYTTGQEESLVIGTDLLYSLLEKVNPHKFTIILTHYPYESLKPEEKTEICRILEQFGVQIWLSGHLHDALVQMHRKAFHEFQCGNLLTDGGAPNVLIGQLDTETGCGEVRAYIWQKNGGWILNTYLDRMAENDKSVYSFELRPTENMKRSGKIYKKVDSKNNKLIDLMVEKIEQTYEDRYTILKECKYGEFIYPVVAKAWTPADIDTIYVIDILDRRTYSFEKMEKWIKKLERYKYNYVKVLNKNVIAELRLILEEPCSEDQEEYYEKNFQDICEKSYKDDLFQLVIMNSNELEENDDTLQKNQVFISSVSVLPVEKEMIYAMDSGIVGKVLASKPVLVGKYESIQEINRWIEQYYQEVWKEWNQLIEDKKEDSMTMEKISAQQEKNEISEGTLTDGLTYEVTHNDAGLLSILFERYLYTGGAHGIPLRKSLIVDLNIGVSISLHEVLPITFTELMQKIKERLYMQYWQEDKETIENFYENIRDRYHQVDDFEFYIQNTALYIYFGVYEIAGYSMGFMDLYMGDLSKYLRERDNIGARDIVRKQAFFEKIEKAEGR